MADLTQMETHHADLHSQSVEVIRRDLDGTPFDLAVTNGRTRVWAERFHEIEPEFLDWVAGFSPDDVLWDIGASIGHFATYAVLKSGCRVVGFEPEAQNYSILTLNHYLNRAALAGRLSPLNVALAPSSGLAEMYIRLYGAGEHTKSLTRDEGNYSIPIMQLGLDQVLSLGVPRPTQLKIDVDGAEAIVLEAVTPLLSEIDSLFIELSVDEIEAATERFATHGLALAETHEVVALRGGTYDEIRNLVYRRG